MALNLKAVVGQKIMTEVIAKERNEKKIEWRALVVDKMAMRMITSSCKMNEISAEGITIVEDLYLQRQPLQSLEAVYLITPCEKSVQCLLKDFANVERIMYKAAHVFFTEACPDDLFNNLSRSRAAKYIQTLKEINISFIPYERQVFYFAYPEAFAMYYGNVDEFASKICTERIAEQIATLCATLGEYPSIRYRSECKRNGELVKIVQQRLNAYKADDPAMGEGAEKARSQLLILDRGFDCVSPVLHELTYQAMVYDLLDIENDLYNYKSTTGTDETMLLDENDELWIDLRHKHIAVVSSTLPTDFKNFTDSKQMAQGEKQTVRDLSTMIKKMPMYRKELAKFTAHIVLAGDCMNQYKEIADKLCRVEQDLATGVDEQGEPIKDHMRNIVHILLNETVSTLDKMRIIILYIISKNGLSEEDLNKVVRHAQLSNEEKQAIINLCHLGLNSVVSGSSDKMYQIPRKERNGEKRYSLSRWIPAIKDLMEDCIDDKLDPKYFPFLAKPVSTPGTIRAATSARYGNWRRGQQTMTRNVPRLIVFVVGGVTFSEIRCAYEVSNAVKSWEVIIGSTHISTPKVFLSDLKTLGN